MRRFFTQLLKALRTGWSRFGFSATASPTPDQARPGDRPVEPPPSSNCGLPETPRNEPVKVESDHPAQESKGDEPVAAATVQRGGNVGDGEPDSEAAGTETAEAAVHRGAATRE